MRTITMLGLLLLLSTGAAAQSGQSKPSDPSDQDPAEKLLYEAFYQESAVRQMDQAAQIYQRAVERALAENQPMLQRDALLGRARCLAALGRHEESRALYQRAVQLDPESAEARNALATEPPSSGVDPELEARLVGLVLKLGGPEREEAARDLKSIGELALPHLEDGLRSRNVAVVERSASLLATVGTEAAYAALMRALDDEQVLFPHLIGKVMSIVPVDESSLPLWREALSHHDHHVRQPAAREFCRMATHSPVDQVGPLLLRAITDEDHSIRLSVMERSYSDEIWQLLVPEIRTMLSSNDRNLRFGAVKAIGKRKGSLEFNDSLLDLLRDSDHLVRGHAAVAIDEAVSPRRQSDRLAERLQFARIAAAELLRSNDPHLIERGARILKRTKLDWDAPLSAAAFEMLLATIRGTRGGSLSSSDREDLLRLPAHGGAVTLSDDQILELYCAAGDPDSVLTSPEVGLLRAVLLQRIETSSSGETARLARWLEVCFRKLRDAGGMSPILQLIHNLTQEGWERWPGFATLVVTPVLLQASASESPQVRSRAYRILSRNHRKLGLDVGIVDRMPRLADDLAGRQSTEDLLEPLFAALLRPRPELALAARRRFELTRGGEEHAEASALRLLVACDEGEAVSELVGVLRDQNRWALQSVALQELVRLQGVDAVPEMVALAVSRGRARSVLAPGSNAQGVLFTDRPEVLGAYVTALPAELIDADLLEAVVEYLPGDALMGVTEVGLSSSSVPVVLAACRIAGMAGIESSLPRLGELLSSGNFKVRNAAEAAIRLIVSRQELRLSRRLLGPAGRAGAIEEAMRLVGSESHVHRQGAALALGALGDPAVIPVLLGLLDDPVVEVREAALRALENLGKISRESQEK